LIRPAPLLVAAGATWSALVIAAPLLGWSLVYAAAHLVCHQLPARTFHLPAGPLAVCARCLGLYLGAVAGGLTAIVMGGGVARHSSAARAFLAAAALPTALTMIGEWFLHWPITNVVRFTAALPLGAAAAWLVMRALEVDWRT
jgi:uncharacterized membrane protein